MATPDHRLAKDIAERASPRDPEVLISTAVVVIFALGYVAAYFVPVPTGSEQAIGQMQGAAIAGLSSVITYWIGSSRGSRRNADRVDKALDVARASTEDKK
jgi:hypothetical protein